MVEKTKKIVKTILYSIVFIIIAFYYSYAIIEAFVERQKRIDQAEIDYLKSEIDLAKSQRDLLSDAIRIAADNGEELALEQAKYLLEEIYCEDSILVWSYCY